MTKDKELLLKYLCMALPYEIVIDYSYNALEMRKGSCKSCIKQDTESLLDFDLLDIFMSPRQNENGEYIKPYLRPLSSMTEEEFKEYKDIDDRCYSCPIDYAHIPALNRIDWMLNKHFDIFDLIPKGLAIAVTEENNPYKEEE